MWPKLSDRSVSAWRCGSSSGCRAEGSVSPATGTEGTGGGWPAERRTGPGTRES